MQGKDTKKVRICNQKFADSDQHFIEACQKASVKPTKRQASKFRNKKGLAWKNQ